MSLRRITAADLNLLVEIVSACPEAAPWSRADFERVVCGEFHGWVAENGNRIVGFVAARVVADEIEILNLAVELASRRNRIGSHLLEEALERGRSAGARRVFLEVRESNRAAQAFYERHGFRFSLRRAHYYSDPREDALVLSRNLDN